MVSKIKHRHPHSALAAAGITLLALTGYFYAAWQHLENWQHLCFALSFGMMTIYFWASQPPADPLLAALDRSKLNELRQLNDVEYRSILLHHRRITPRMLRELKRAITEQNSDDIQRLAGRLRSSAMEIGAYRFAALAQSIEHCAKMNDLRLVSLLFSDAGQAYYEVDQALMRVGADH